MDTIASLSKAKENCVSGNTTKENLQCLVTLVGWSKPNTVCFIRTESLRLWSSDLTESARLAN